VIGCGVVVHAEIEELAAEIVDSLSAFDIGRGHGSTARLLAGAAFGLMASIRPSPRAAPVFDGRVNLIVNNPVEHGARFGRALARSLPDAAPSKVFADARHADPRVGEIQDLPGVGLRSIHALGSAPRLRLYSRLRRLPLVSEHISTAPDRLRAEVAFLSQTLRYQAALETNFSRTSLILTDFDRGATARPWVWAAKRSGTAVATALHGSPASATYLPLLADSVLAWGSAQSDWLYARRADARIHVVGRADLESRTSVSDRVDRLVICHSREELLPAEQEGLLALIRDVGGIEVILRQHPSVRGRLHESWRSIEERAQVVSAAGQPLSSFLGPGDFVAGVASTALVEALISGHGVAVIAAPSRSLPADLETIARLSPGFTAGTGHPHAQLSPQYVEQLESLSTRIVAAVGSEAARATSAAILELADQGSNRVAPDSASEA
jgi:hypothetical protein